jgi:hypothetical protein
MSDKEILLFLLKVQKCLKKQGYRRLKNGKIVLPSELLKVEICVHFLSFWTEIIHQAWRSGC